MTGKLVTSMRQEVPTRTIQCSALNHPVQRVEHPPQLILALWYMVR